MIDYHCHLDLYPNPLKIFDEVKSKEVDVLAVTTSPRAYIKTSQYFSNLKKVRVAVGLHPELVAQRQSEWTLFMQIIKKCKYIGEIGIDGSQRFRDSLDIQTTFFREALAEVERNRDISSVFTPGVQRNKFYPLLNTQKEIVSLFFIGLWEALKKSSGQLSLVVGLV